MIALLTRNNHTSVGEKEKKNDWIATLAKNKGDNVLFPVLKVMRVTVDVIFSPLFVCYL